MTLAGVRSPPDPPKLFGSLVVVLVPLLCGVYRNASFVPFMLTIWSPEILDVSPLWHQPICQSVLILLPNSSSSGLSAYQA